MTRGRRARDHDRHRYSFITLAPRLSTRPSNERMSKRRRVGWKSTLVNPESRDPLEEPAARRTARRGRARDRQAVPVRENSGGYPTRSAARAQLACAFATLLSRVSVRFRHATPPSRHPSPTVELPPPPPAARALPRRPARRGVRRARGAPRLSLSRISPDHPRRARAGARVHHPLFLRREPPAAHCPRESFAATASSAVHICLCRDSDDPTSFSLLANFRDGRRRVHVYDASWNVG